MPYSEFNYLLYLDRAGRKPYQEVSPRKNLQDSEFLTTRFHSLTATTLTKHHTTPSVARDTIFKIFLASNRRRLTYTDPIPRKRGPRPHDTDFVSIATVDSLNRDFKNYIDVDSGYRTRFSNLVNVRMADP